MTFVWLKHSVPNPKILRVLSAYILVNVCGKIRLGTGRLPGAKEGIIGLLTGAASSACACACASAIAV